MPYLARVFLSQITLNLFFQMLADYMTSSVLVTSLMSTQDVLFDSYLISGCRILSYSVVKGDHCSDIKSCFHESVILIIQELLYIEMYSSKD